MTYADIKTQLQYEMGKVFDYVKVGTVAPHITETCAYCGVTIKTRGKYLHCVKAGEPALTMVCPDRNACHARRRARDTKREAAVEKCYVPVSKEDKR